jgi:UDPglucose--hexose-1-phosphate uridylyltransferase
VTTRTDAVLADGRQLFYYDRGTGRALRAGGSPPDCRQLEPPAPASQLRWDSLFGEFAVIAGHRRARAHHPLADDCPLDPSRPGRPTEIPAADYEVVVFENRYPPFSAAIHHSVGFTEAPFKSAPGFGRCEVVAFSSEHNTSFSRLPLPQARLVVDALADRTTELRRMESVAYVYCFENRGEDIGATLPHPHGQIYGYPFIPPRFARLTASLSDFRDRVGGCRQCALLDAELGAEARIVCQNSSWVAYVPFAARWPCEVRIVPRRHVPDLPALTDLERDDLVGLYVDVLARFDLLYGFQAPYVSGWQQAPVRGERALWHFAVEVFTIRRAPDRLKYLAGSESGAGVWINDVVPETCAARLRHASHATSE